MPGSSVFSVIMTPWSNNWRSGWVSKAAVAPVQTLLVMQTSRGICSATRRRINSGSSMARMP